MRLTILSIAIGELETRMRSQAEGYQTSLAQTKQRAAQMLAKKDALLQLRQAGSPPHRPRTRRCRLGRLGRRA